MALQGFLWNPSNRAAAMRLIFLDRIQPDQRVGTRLQGQFHRNPRKTDIYWKDCNNSYGRLFQHPIVYEIWRNRLPLVVWWIRTQAPVDKSVDNFRKRRLILYDRYVNDELMIFWSVYFLYIIQYVERKTWNIGRIFGDGHDKSLTVV